eukprot:TRINITY_DN2191_c0_g1_i4.p1 TRINITY_DN2191_c0_g1~~TRINITY_DN2191_c0_g1_i4.p1  ORF type:complete len:269 (+),score=45.87 TRINITY_DN2191_c0_g1_i4:302-1108(+)
MSLFLSLRDSRHACMPAFVERQCTAEANRDRIARAVVAIQSIRRGIVKRREIKKMKNAAIYLQRIWRGFLAREIAAHTSMLRDRTRAHMLWFCAARVIQKSFRAYYSRRYRHSYYERQAYLHAVTIKDQNVREVSEAVAERTQEERLQLLDQEERSEFEELTSNLHHLTSTRTTPGVYNSPFVEPLTAFGTPMEEHLQNSFKKSKYCHRHLRRSMGSEVYARTFQRFGQSGSLSAGKTQGAGNSQTYQHASMPRPVETYKLQPLYENN